MILKNIKDRDVITNLLNDDGEWLFGMNLVLTYQTFINLAKYIFKLYNKKYKSKWNFTLFFKEKLEKEIYTQDTIK